jgi:hypothetical protein
MSSTPQDRNIIATSGRSTATEDEVYRVLDIKDFSTVGAGAREDLIFSPGSTISINSYPIYENLLQFPPELSFKSLLFQDIPWSLIDGRPFGWYERTLLVLPYNKNKNNAELIAINMDNTAEQIRFGSTGGNLGFRPVEDFVIRGGFVYSGFLKMTNNPLSIFEKDTTFTALLPNGQFGTTTITTTSFERGFNSGEYIYFASYFTATVGSGLYLWRTPRLGSFNLEVLELMDTVVQPAQVLYVSPSTNGIVWLLGGASGETFQKYDRASNILSTFTSHPTIVDPASPMWPQQDGSLKWFYFGAGGAVLLYSISVTGQITSTPTGINRADFGEGSWSIWSSLYRPGPLAPSNQDEYFLQIRDYVGSVLIMKILKFSFNTAGTLEWVTTPVPSASSRHLRWSNESYADRARWVGSDASESVWALYEQTL